MTPAQLKRFEQRWEDGLMRVSLLQYSLKEISSKAYTAACEDEAKRVEGLVRALEAISNGSVTVSLSFIGRDIAMEIIAADAIKEYKGEK